MITIQRRLFSNRQWMALLALIIACVIAYFPILGNDFIYGWDDHSIIKPFMKSGFTWQSIKSIFTEFFLGQYAPLNEMLYLSLEALFGFEPLPFHLASMTLHALNVSLVYICLSIFLGMISSFNAYRIKPVALLTALMLAVHPLNVEAVAWVSAAKVLIYVFFYLLATYTFLRFLKGGKKRFLIWTLVLYTCSFLGKEQAVTFPLWMLLIYWIIGRNLKDKKIWFTVLPFFGLALLFGVVTMASHSVGILSGDDTYPFYQRIVYAFYAFAEYLFKSVFPFKLSYLYPFPSVVGEPLPVWLLAYPALIAVVAIIFGKRLYNNKILLFGVLFFLIHIAITLHIIPLSRLAVTADRYVYLSLVGICFVLSYGTVFLYKIKKMKALSVSLMLAYILYLGAYTNHRCRVWFDTDSVKKELRELLKERPDFND